MIIEHLIRVPHFFCDEGGVESVKSSAYVRFVRCHVGLHLFQLSFLGGDLGTSLLECPLCNFELGLQVIGMFVSFLQGGFQVGRFISKPNTSGGHVHVLAHSPTDS